MNNYIMHINLVQLVHGAYSHRIVCVYLCIEYHNKLFALYDYDNDFMTQM